MPLSDDTPLAILNESVCLKDFQPQPDVDASNKIILKKSPSETLKSNAAKCLFISGSSDSGKSSSGSPNLLNCSFDSGILSVLRNGNDMQLHKRIQQCQCILLALERDEEYFSMIRNRLSKITKSKQKKCSENEVFCNVCCAEIDSNNEKTYVKCYICKKFICRNIKCSNWLPKTAEWECELCQTSKESLAQTSSWVADQITFNQEKLICPPRARSEIYIPISDYNDSVVHFESVSQVGANSTAITAEQKFKLREYVEQIVAKLLGGNLDTVAVNQLSNSANCLPEPKAENIHNGTSSDSVAVKSTTNDFTDISETRLRQMIQKIIAETINLTPFTNGHATSEIVFDGSRRTSDNISLSNNNAYNQRHHTEHYFKPTIYQDLLATAVLNKIVDKELRTNRNVPDRNDSVDFDVLNDNKKFTSSDQNFNIEKISTSSGSSVEPRSDCSYPEEEQILNNNDDKSCEFLRNSDRDSVISDYLANHMIPLPELNAMAESEDDDHTSVTSSAVGDGTWEKNWLFKKKKSTLSSSVTASSVGMLVPDPKEDVRAQIGDKTADEVSDLSELGSDSDDSLNSLRSQLEPINDRLINKHLIGGQNSKMILDELIDRSSRIISNSKLPNPDDSLYIDVCNEHLITTNTKTEAINNNLNQQKSIAEQQAEGSRKVLYSAGAEDINSNSLKASDNNTESEGCTGFSAIEIIESTTRTPSVVEILAAMALGPMLAVSSADHPATMTVSDFSAFTELKELALEEIKSHSSALTPHNLDVILEESPDATNQTDVLNSNKNLTSVQQMDLIHHQESDNCCLSPLFPELKESENEINSSLSQTQQQLPAAASVETIAENPENVLDKSADEITSNERGKETELLLDKVDLDIDKNRVEENMEKEENIACDRNSDAILHDNSYPENSTKSNEQNQVEIISKENISDSFDASTEQKSQNLNTEFQTEKTEIISNDLLPSVELQEVLGSNLELVDINNSDNISHAEINEQQEIILKSQSEQDEIKCQTQEFQTLISASDEHLEKTKKKEKDINEQDTESILLIQTKNKSEMETKEKSSTIVLQDILETSNSANTDSSKHLEVLEMHSKESNQTASPEQSSNINVQCISEKTTEVDNEQCQIKDTALEEQANRFNQVIYETQMKQSNSTDIANYEKSKDESKEKDLDKHSRKLDEKNVVETESEIQTQQIKNTLSENLESADIEIKADETISKKQSYQKPDNLEIVSAEQVDEVDDKINSVDGEENILDKDLRELDGRNLVEQTEQILSTGSACDEYLKAEAESLHECPLFIKEIVSNEPNITQLQEDSIERSVSLNQADVDKLISADPISELHKEKIDNLDSTTDVFPRDAKTAENNYIEHMSALDQNISKEQPSEMQTEQNQKGQTIDSPDNTVNQQTKIREYPGKLIEMTSKENSSCDTQAEQFEIISREYSCSRSNGDNENTKNNVHILNEHARTSDKLNSEPQLFEICNEQVKTDSTEYLNIVNTSNNEHFQIEENTLDEDSRGHDEIVSKEQNYEIQTKHPQADKEILEEYSHAHSQINLKEPTEPINNEQFTIQEDNVDELSLAISQTISDEPIKQLITIETLSNEHSGLTNKAAIEHLNTEVDTSYEHSATLADDISEELSSESNANNNNSNEQVQKKESILDNHSTAVNLSDITEITTDDSKLNESSSELQEINKKEKTCESLIEPIILANAANDQEIETQPMDIIIHNISNLTYIGDNDLSEHIETQIQEDSFGRSVSFNQNGADKLISTEQITETHKEKIDNLHFTADVFPRDATTVENIYIEHMSAPDENISKEQPSEIQTEQIQKDQIIDSPDNTVNQQTECLEYPGKLIEMTSKENSSRDTQTEQFEIISNEYSCSRSSGDNENTKNNVHILNEHARESEQQLLEICNEQIKTDSTEYLNIVNTSDNEHFQIEENTLDEGSRGHDEIVSKEQNYEIQTKHPQADKEILEEYSHAHSQINLKEPTEQFTIQEDNIDELSAVVSQTISDEPIKQLITIETHSNEHSGLTNKAVIEHSKTEVDTSYEHSATLAEDISKELSSESNANNNNSNEQVQKKESILENHSTAVKVSDITEITTDDNKLNESSSELHENNRNEKACECLIEPIIEIETQPMDTIIHDISNSTHIRVNELSEEIDAIMCKEQQVEEIVDNKEEAKHPKIVEDDIEKTSKEECQAVAEIQSSETQNEQNKIVSNHQSIENVISSISKSSFAADNELDEVNSREHPLSSQSQEISITKPAIEQPINEKEIFNGHLTEVSQPIIEQETCETRSEQIAIIPTKQLMDFAINNISDSKIIKNNEELKADETISAEISYQAENKQTEKVPNAEPVESIIHSCISDPNFDTSNELNEKMSQQQIKSEEKTTGTQSVELNQSEKQSEQLVLSAIVQNTSDSMIIADNKAAQTDENKLNECSGEISEKISKAETCVTQTELIALKNVNNESLENIPKKEIFETENVQAEIVLSTKLIELSTHDASESINIPEIEHIDPNNTATENSENKGETADKHSVEINLKTKQASHTQNEELKIGPEMTAHNISDSAHINENEQPAELGEISSLEQEIEIENKESFSSNDVCEHYKNKEHDLDRQTTEDGRNVCQEQPSEMQSEHTELISNNEPIEVISHNISDSALPIDNEIISATQDLQSLTSIAETLDGRSTYPNQIAFKEEASETQNKQFGIVVNEESTHAIVDNISNTTITVDNAEFKTEKSKLNESSVGNLKGEIRGTQIEQSSLKNTANEQVGSKEDRLDKQNIFKQELFEIKTEQVGIVLSIKSLELSLHDTSSCINIEEREHNVTHNTATEQSDIKEKTSEKHITEVSETTEQTSPIQNEKLEIGSEIIDHNKSDSTHIEENGRLEELGEICCMQQELKIEFKESFSTNDMTEHSKNLEDDLERPSAEGNQNVMQGEHTELVPNNKSIEAISHSISDTFVITDSKLNEITSTEPPLTIQSQQFPINNAVIEQPITGEDTLDEHLVELNQKTFKEEASEAGNELFAIVLSEQSTGISNSVAIADNVTKKNELKEHSEEILEITSNDQTCETQTKPIAPHEQVESKVDSLDKPSSGENISKKKVFEIENGQAEIDLSAKSAEVSIRDITNSMNIAEREHNISYNISTKQSENKDETVDKPSQEISETTEQTSHKRNVTLEIVPEIIAHIATNEQSERLGKISSMGQEPKTENKENIFTNDVKENIKNEEDNLDNQSTENIQNIRQDQPSETQNKQSELITNNQQSIKVIIHSASHSTATTDNKLNEIDSSETQNEQYEPIATQNQQIQTYNAVIEQPKLAEETSYEHSTELNQITIEEQVVSEKQSEQFSTVLIEQSTNFIHNISDSTNILDNEAPETDKNKINESSAAISEIISEEKSCEKQTEPLGLKNASNGQVESEVDSLDKRSLEQHISIQETFETENEQAESVLSAKSIDLSIHDTSFMTNIPEIEHMVPYNTVTEQSENNDETADKHSTEISQTIEQESHIQIEKLELGPEIIAHKISDATHIEENVRPKGLDEINFMEPELETENKESFSANDMADNDFNKQSREDDQSVYQEQPSDIQNEQPKFATTNQSIEVITDSISDATVTAGKAIDKIILTEQPVTTQNQHIPTDNVIIEPPNNKEETLSELNQLTFKAGASETQTEQYDKVLFEQSTADIVHNISNSTIIADGEKPETDKNKLNKCSGEIFEKTSTEDTQTEPQNVIVHYIPDSTIIANKQEPQSKKLDERPEGIFDIISKEEALKTDKEFKAEEDFVTHDSRSDDQIMLTLEKEQSETVPSDYLNELADNISDATNIAPNEQSDLLSERNSEANNTATEEHENKNDTSDEQSIGVSQATEQTSRTENVKSEIITNEQPTEMIAHNTPDSTNIGDNEPSDSPDSVSSEVYNFERGGEERFACNETADGKQSRESSQTVCKEPSSETQNEQSELISNNQLDSTFSMDNELDKENATTQLLLQQITKADLEEPKYDKETLVEHLAAVNQCETQSEPIAIPAAPQLAHTIVENISDSAVIVEGEEPKTDEKKLNECSKDLYENISNEAAVCIETEAVPIVLTNAADGDVENEIEQINDNSSGQKISDEEPCETENEQIKVIESIQILQLTTSDTSYSTSIEKIEHSISYKSETEIPENKIETVTESSREICIKNSENQISKTLGDKIETSPSEQSNQHSSNKGDNLCESSIAVTQTSSEEQSSDIKIGILTSEQSTVDNIENFTNNEINEYSSNIHEAAAPSPELVAAVNAGPKIKIKKPKNKNDNLDEYETVINQTITSKQSSKVQSEQIDPREQSIETRNQNVTDSTINDRNETIKTASHVINKTTFETHNEEAEEIVSNNNAPEYRRNDELISTEISQPVFKEQPSEKHDEQIEILPFSDSTNISISEQLTTAEHVVNEVKEEEEKDDSLVIQIRAFETQNDEQIENKKIAEEVIITTNITDNEELETEQKTFNKYSRELDEIIPNAEQLGTQTEQIVANSSANEQIINIEDTSDKRSMQNEQNEAVSKEPLEVMLDNGSDHSQKTFTENLKSPIETISKEQPCESQTEQSNIVDNISNDDLERSVETIERDESLETQHEQVQIAAEEENILQEQSAKMQSKQLEKICNKNSDSASTENIENSEIKNNSLEKPSKIQNDQILILNDAEINNLAKDNSIRKSNFEEEEEIVNEQSFEIITEPGELDSHEKSDEEQSSNQTLDLTNSVQNIFDSTANEKPKTKEKVFEEQPEGLDENISNQQTSEVQIEMFSNEHSVKIEANAGPVNSETNVELRNTSNDFEKQLFQTQPDDLLQAKQETPVNLNEQNETTLSDKKSPELQTHSKSAENISEQLSSGVHLEDNISISEICLQDNFDSAQGNVDKILTSSELKNNLNTDADENAIKDNITLAISSGTVIQENVAESFKENVSKNISDKDICKIEDTTTITEALPPSQLLKEKSGDEALQVEMFNILKNQESSEDTPSLTRQITVLNIVENSENLMEDNESKATDSLPSAISLATGKSNFQKKLHRQCRVVDTTPSFEDVSPLPKPQTTTLNSQANSSNSLADLCQKFINDKQLLTALANRRRRTLLMHRFLSTLDLSHSIDDRMKETETDMVHTEVLITENPVVYESLTHSCDHASDHDDCSDSPVLQINNLNKVSYNFINTILFSDQLSYETKSYYDSGTSTIEEYIDNDNDEKHYLALNFNNKSATTNTPLTALTTNTNIIKETSSRSTKNPTKQSVTNMSGCLKTNPSNQRHPSNNSLISAVQNKETSFKTNRQCRGEHGKVNEDNVKAVKNRKDSDGIHINVCVHDYEDASIDKDEHKDIDDVEDDDDDADNDDDDDVVAIFRHFVPGSIAEREYKKWYNAVEMPNNPYAPEALKRRISGSQERFIDLPNISPTKDLNPLDLLNEPTLQADDDVHLQNDYKRYSRDYYVNSSLIAQQGSPARDVVTPPNTKENRESMMKATPSSKENETKIDLYKAMPAHVIEINSSSMDTLSTISKEAQTNATSISDDSDTIKFHNSEQPQEANVIVKDDKKEPETADVLDAKEKPSSLVVDRSENNGNTIAPARGSTPVAFKFLQPKRKLLEPNQILTVDEEGPQTSTSPIEKPVIEAEVVKSLPSVKALARAFLLTTSTTQPEKLWLRKARTLSQSGKKHPLSPKRSADQCMHRLKPEDDLTITSDLSSLETDSSSVGIEIATTSTSNLTAPPAASSTNDPSSHTDADNISPVLLRQGVLKNNIAFFENLKNK